MARVCEFAFEALFFVLAVTLVVAANYFTACMLKHQSATIFHGVFGVGYKLGTKVAISIVAIGEVINSVFDSAGVLIVVDMCKSALKAVGKAIIHPIETYRQRKADWQYTRSHPMRLVATIAKVAEYLFLTKAVIFNSVGQGIGSVPGGASKVVVGLAISSGAMSSAGTQLEAVEEKTRLPEKVEGIESKAVAVVSKDNPYRLFSSAKPRVRKTEPDEDPLESHDKITISAG
ncbi:MAG: hypothetical protein KDH94_07595, partial [Coxiellaceae bacterium]|nr:hypothetical protein [Coxiellaceae bacterium]